MEEQQLMEYFKFDASDLNANRNGTLTEKQKTRLNAELREARKSRTRWAYFLFFLAAIGIAIALGIWFIPDSGLGMRIGFGIGFGLVCPLYMGWWALRFYRPPHTRTWTLPAKLGESTL